MDVRERYDFNERMRHAVEVDQMRRGRLKGGLCRVLLQLHLLDADGDGRAARRAASREVVRVERDVTVLRKRLCTADLLGQPLLPSTASRRRARRLAVVLRDLVAGRLVVVKVMLAVEGAAGLGLAAQC